MTASVLLLSCLINLLSVNKRNNTGMRNPRIVEHAVDYPVPQNLQSSQILIYICQSMDIRSCIVKSLEIIGKFTLSGKDMISGWLFIRRGLESPMMREVSLEILPNVNVCDASHDKIFRLRLESVSIFFFYYVVSRKRCVYTFTNIYRFPKQMF